MTTPFQFLDSIYKTKENVFDPDNTKEYNKFMINRGLSYNIDCLFYSNELNRFADIPEKAHYEFLLEVIDKKPRYGKWFKKEHDDADVLLIMEMYKYSKEKAEHALDILTDEQLQKMRNAKGGKNVRRANPV